MNTPTTVLITTLENQTKDYISQAESFLELPHLQLTHRPGKGRWNVLECIEHLNRYGAFYLPEIRKRISESPFPPATTFSSGIIGNYFVNSMEPKKGMKKIKTFKDKDPLNAILDKQCIQTFIGQQIELLELLKLSRKVDLNRTKTSISITKLLTLKLGDTLRFLIAHNKRHLVQAFEAMVSLKNGKELLAASI